MMIAFKNDESLKEKYLTRVQQHREADELVQNYGYWQDGKGCAIGCLAHKDTDAHSFLESEWDVDIRLLYLADTIFEGLPVAAARLWPERFTASIHSGSDTSLIHHQFCSWLLGESGLLAITDGNRASIDNVRLLHARAANREDVTVAEWSAAAARAAESAASAAWSAAWSAASAASAASSAARAESAAESAAWAAARAAWSAESAAWSAARAAAFEKIADKLVDLFLECRA